VVVSPLKFSRPAPALSELRFRPPAKRESGPVTPSLASFPCQYCSTDHSCTFDDNGPCVCHSDSLGHVFTRKPLKPSHYCTSTLRSKPLYVPELAPCQSFSPFLRFFHCVPETALIVFQASCFFPRGMPSDDGVFGHCFSLILFSSVCL